MGRFIDRTGEVRFNTFGSEMIITEYRGCDDIDVYFPQYNHTVRKRGYRNFKKGAIRCPYEPRVCGVGYLGEGDYKSCINNVTTKEYECWLHIITRYYNPNASRYKEGYTVCEEWHNFQNFAEWYNDNYYEVEGHEMVVSCGFLTNDKVITPDNTIFTPCAINTLRVRRGLSRNYNKYQVMITYTTLNKEQHIEYYGLYDTQEQAKLVYKKEKERIFRELADEYKEHIPSKLYDYMKNFVLDIEDIRILSEGEE